MNIFLKISFCLFILIQISSCNKSDKPDTSVKGKVINDITGEPMEGVRIVIVEYHCSGIASGLNCDYNNIKTVFKR